MKSSLADIKSIEDFDLKGQRVFLRLDLNVPIKSGQITDTTRIVAALPTIKYAMDHGAKLIIASHLGRPEKGNHEEFSLEPVGRKLGELLDAEAMLVDEPDSEAPIMLFKNLKSNQFLLLENLRFHEDETENGEGLAKAIATYTDIYINDAFGASHRAHSSIVALPKLIKNRGVGFLMKKELEMLDKVIESPDSPFVTILGGAKVSDKIGVIENLVDRVDTFLIGGAMAYTFLSALGKPVGLSRVEKDKAKYVKDLVERFQLRKKKLMLPIDHKIVSKFDAVNTLQVTPGVDIPDGWMGIDIGPKTAQLYRKELTRAKTVFWNGPMGVFETPEYAEGTFAIARQLAELNDATTIVGGGDSAAAINLSGYADRVTHISTGGGASLEFLQGDKLPGIEALKPKSFLV